MAINQKEAVDSRCTFVAISYPDAGKTTITEQSLLFGGAIRQAGTVKGKKTGSFAKSNWMEVEKQRGTSVTSSVMQFDYQDKRINILDTPGHEDLSGDTYRILIAADSAVMATDSARRIEARTKKLFQVVKKRGIPIFTFINRLDHNGWKPLELLEELEELLDIESYPISWPVGMGKGLEGLYDIYSERVELCHPENNGGERFIPLRDGDTPSDLPLHNNSIYQQVLGDVELLVEAGDESSEGKIARGGQTPVFFGSALTSFGAQAFLETLLQFASAPHTRKTEEGGEVSPYKKEFSDFIFRIQANMNPAHHDRIAFVQIRSSVFERGMDVTLGRTSKKAKLSNVTQFMADARENITEAVIGDIIGAYGTGNYQIGDTLYEGKMSVQYEELPSFTPELFVKVIAKDVMKQESFHKGIYRLVQEGAIQLYKTYLTKECITGAVGQLQFEVFQYRMSNEYNVGVVMTPMGSKIAHWINPEDLDERMSSSRNILVRDRFDQPLFLFESQFAERRFADKYPDVKLKSLM